MTGSEDIICFLKRTFISIFHLLDCFSSSSNYSKSINFAPISRKMHLLSGTFLTIMLASYFPSPSKSDKISWNNFFSSGTLCDKGFQIELMNAIVQSFIYLYVLLIIGMYHWMFLFHDIFLSIFRQYLFIVKAICWAWYQEIFSYTLMHISFIPTEIINLIVRTC